MAFSGQGYVVKPHDNLGWKPQVVTNEDLYRELQYINATHSVVNGHLQDVRLALDAMQVAMRADQERQQFVQAELRTMMSRLADLANRFVLLPFHCSWKSEGSSIRASSAVCTGLVAASSGSVTKNSSYSDL